MSEKDQLLNDMDKLREQLSSSAGLVWFGCFRNSLIIIIIIIILGTDSLLDFSCFEDVMAPGNCKQSAINIRQLQIQLQQTEQLSDWYREQCIKQEDELGRLKEEGISILNY